MHAKAKIGKLLVAAVLLTCLPAGAQSPPGSSPQMQGSAQVSMVVFQVRSNPDGSQMVVARDGSLVPLPPPGIAASATEVPVYADTSGHYWYQSQSGQAVPIYDSRLTWSQSTPPPQSQPQSQDSQKKGRRGSGVLGTALGAAAGAALGTAMVSSQYGVPYGTPVYPGNPGSLYYVGPNGYPVYVNPANASALYNQYAVQQQVVQTNRLNYQNSAQQSALQFQQEAYQNSLNYQQQRQAQYQANQAANQAARQPAPTQPAPSQFQAPGQTQAPAQVGTQSEGGRFGRRARAAKMEGAGEAAQTGRFGRRGAPGEGAGEAAQTGRFGRRGAQGEGAGAGLQSGRTGRQSGHQSGHQSFGGARTEGIGKSRRGAQAAGEARSFNGGGSRNKGGRHRGR